MAGVTFSEVEIKKLILALAGSKGSDMSESADEAQESPEHEAKPEDKSEDAAEGESPDKEDSAGKPHGESTKSMLERKLKDK